MSAGLGVRPSESLRAFDAFLAIFRETCLREGGDLAHRVAARLDRLPPARLSVPPRDQPATGHLRTLMRFGIPETAPLLGAVAELAARMPWQRGNEAKASPRYRVGHSFCTLVGPEAWVPAEDMRLGLYLQAPNLLYPAHRHAAEELYFTLAGTGEWAKGARPPTAEDFVPMPPGVFIRHGPWQTHAMRTTAQPILAVWAWLGDLDGGYVWD